MRGPRRCALDKTQAISGVVVAAGMALRRSAARRRCTAVLGVAGADARIKRGPEIVTAAAAGDAPAAQRGRVAAVVPCNHVKLLAQRGEAIGCRRERTDDRV